MNTNVLNKTEIIEIALKQKNLKTYLSVDLFCIQQINPEKRIIVFGKRISGKVNQLKVVCTNL